MKTDVPSSGFTLIELIMVIALIGILASVGLPFYRNVVVNAYESQAKGISVEIQAGIQLIFAKSAANPEQTDLYPTQLDSATLGACLPVNPCFGVVLHHPIQNGTWEKNSAHRYTHIRSGYSCTYQADPNLPQWGQWACMPLL